MPIKKPDKYTPLIISGRVIPGHGQGAGLGFRTANLDPKLAGDLPPGLFSCEVNIGGKHYAGLLFHGKNSLSEQLCLEVHLKDFNGNLLGQKIDVLTGRFLRPPIKFKEREDLRTQIQKDIGMFFD